ncbi:MAG: hypothetical protein H7329_15915 [Opitutaceae bacterium]|nr:hypothetical protein [Cytophagales bacterium]
MKKSILILIPILIFNLNSFSQGYFSENEVTLSLYQEKKTLNWFSTKLTTSLDLERSEMVLHVDAATFISQKDSLKNILLFNSNCPAIHIALTLPFNKLDKDLSGRQVFLVQGILSGCGNNYPVNVNVGFQFLDKLLMFDFRLKLEAAAIGATGLRGIDPIVLFHTDNGRILLRSKE